MRKIHKELGKKGREAIGSGEGTQRKKEMARAETHLGSERHRLGVPFLGSCAGEMSPLGWLQDCWD